MVARSNQNTNPDIITTDLNNRDSNKSSISNSDTKHHHRSMEREAISPERENYLIEAIVFTTDFLSCGNAKKGSAGATRGSPWICGGGFAETEHPFDGGDGIDHGEGWFGMSRKQLISYENAEDLTRKVDALFHETHSNDNSNGNGGSGRTEPSAAPEIRDDDPGIAERYENHTDHNGDGSDDCRPRDTRQRRVDAALARSTTTNHSRTPSNMSQEELHRWYSSSWYSYTYHGNAKHHDTFSNELTMAPSRSISKSHQHQHHTRRLDPPKRKPSGHPPHGNSTRDNHRRRRKTSDSGKRSSSSSSSEPPEFLRGVEFKSSRTRPHPFPAIALPPREPSFPQPPIGNGAEEDRSGGENDSRADVDPSEGSTRDDRGYRGTNAATIRRRRRLRGLWGKTRRIFFR